MSCTGVFRMSKMISSRNLIMSSFSLWFVNYTQQKRSKTKTNPKPKQKKIETSLSYIIRVCVRARACVSISFPWPWYCKMYSGHLAIASEFWNISLMNIEYEIVSFASVFIEEMGSFSELINFPFMNGKIRKNQVTLDHIHFCSYTNSCSVCPFSLNIFCTRIICRVPSSFHHIDSVYRFFFFFDTKTFENKWSTIWPWTLNMIQVDANHRHRSLWSCIRAQSPYYYLLDHYQIMDEHANDQNMSDLKIENTIISLFVNQLK